MSGFGGRYSVRRSSRGGQSNRWCATVSSGHGQRGHLESVTTPILLRCELRGTCCDLNRKMVTCSSLLRVLMWSFGFGVAICINMDRPVSFSAHSFLQSSFLFCLMICFAVFMDAVLFCCGHLAPCFASLSACSFPGMFVWPGIHCRVISMVWAVMTLLIFLDSFLIVMSLRSSFPRASRTDLASEKMTMLFLGFTFSVKIFDMW